MSKKCLASLALTAAFAATLASAQSEGGVAGTFVDSMDVEVVEVDVVVTDRRGRPVLGLGRNNFELHADGERVEITNFSDFASILESPPGVRAGEAVGEDPGAVDTDAAAPPAAIEQLSIVLYLDVANLHPPHLTRALNRLEEAVEPWREWNASFMLATFRKRLEIIVPPTRDLDRVLAAALERRRGMPSALQQHLARRNAISEVIETDPACEGLFMSVARSYAAAEERRLDRALLGLTDLVSTLAGVPGKKAVIYVGSGLPQQPGMSLFSFLADQQCGGSSRVVSRLYSDMQSYDESRRVQALATQANANRVTFFTVDASGVGGGLAMDMSMPLGMSQSLAENDRVHRMSGQSGMNTLAQETGGRLLANSNDLAELVGNATELLAASYSLGFMPEEIKPGRVRQLRVALAPHASDGRRVLYRKNYRHKALPERLAERLVSVMHLGDLKNPLAVRVGFDEPKKRGRRRFALGVNLVVPEESVALLPGRRGKSGEIRLWMLAAEKNKGTRSSVREKLVAVGGRRGLAPKAGVYWFNIKMRLGAGEYDVAVGVRDETSGLTSLLRLPVSVTARSKVREQRRRG